MPRIYAHRGASGDYPENTLLAFRHALDSGVDGIELDVQLTSEGVPVVIHDRDLSRTTNGAGAVDATSLAELQALDAGRGERVPRLSEVLELAQDRLHLDIEVKGQGRQGRQGGQSVAREVLAALASAPAATWAVSSFDWETLRCFRQLRRQAELWPIARRADAALFAIAEELSSPYVALFHEAYTPDSARALRDASRRVMVWAVNDAEEATRVSGLGADAICTAFPAQIGAAFRDR